MEASEQEQASARVTTTHVILFYKYHPLSEDRGLMASYRSAFEALCRTLDLRGRILIGCSKNEGINGTLSGQYENVKAFTLALLLYDKRDDSTFSWPSGVPATAQTAVEQFWSQCRVFFESIGEAILQMKSPEDFKWSKTENSENQKLFPDLNVKLVSELIGSGGIMKEISIAETSQGYLDPREWHEEVTRAKDCPDTVIIDCRNTKEYDIGHFDGSLDPKTTTYAQFPKWVKDHEHILTDKKVLMYCTGGIRCEKASAFLRKEVKGVKSVSHLRGGIHKYLEEFGDSGTIWKGRNFVFDQRQAATASETQRGRSAQNGLEMDNQPSNDHNSVVGNCIECRNPYDSFDARCVCTVCREPTLVCQTCQEERRVPDFHCKNHFHLKDCYFTHLEAFSSDELAEQARQLERIFEEISVGKRFKQKRRTILKQLERITRKLQEPQSELSISGYRCRNCGESLCSGKCWGFYGLKRKRVLEGHIPDESKKASDIRVKPASTPTVPVFRKEPLLWISKPPSSFRDEHTGLRVPPCITRKLSCNAKAKWCGQLCIDVIKQEFQELVQTDSLASVIEHGLLRVNGLPLDIFSVSEKRICNSDVLERVKHWHEPPVVVPSKISVKRLPLPSHIFGDNAEVLVCDKPSTVPVHPAGPFLSNCLTAMVEAQEGIDSHTLHPVHRIDRVTSGVVLCAGNRKVLRILSSCIAGNKVEKLYLAKVGGRFLSSCSDAANLSSREGSVKVFWSKKSSTLAVDAPVKTLDPANGIRGVEQDGKPAKTLFKLLSYNEEEDSSVVLCTPITGRNHQIRVHLQALGFPILGDSLYGGKVEACQEKSLVVAALEAKRDEPEYILDSPGISEVDCQTARMACKVCSEEVPVDSLFSSSQLLQGGHAIHLHALRYRVNIPQKREVQHFTLDVCVDFPDWYNERHDELLDFLVE